MLIINSRNGLPVRLSQERWGHIIRRHPEMEEQKDRVLETVSDPDVIQRGDFGEVLAIHLYPKTPLTRKYLVVVYKEAENDGFVLTAYFTSSPSKRRIVLWKR